MNLPSCGRMVLGRVRLHLRPEEVFGYLRPSQPYLRVKRAIDTLVVIPALGSGPNKRIPIATAM